MTDSILAKNVTGAVSRAWSTWQGKFVLPATA